MKLILLLVCFATAGCGSTISLGLSDEKGRMLKASINLPEKRGYAK